MNLYLGTVYRIYLKSDLSQSYVGSTFQTVEERFKQHCKAINIEKNANRPLYIAMKLLGAEAFDVDELCTYGCEDEAELKEYEQMWINTIEPPLNATRAFGLTRETTEGKEARRLYKARHRKDPAVRKRIREYERKRREDPAFSAKRQESNRK